MFLNEPKFIKQVKKAYRTKGITIADYKKSLVIDIGDITVAISYDDVSNKIKGLVMELGGVFPKANSLYHVSRTNPVPAHEPNENILKALTLRLENSEEAINKLHYSYFSRGSNYLMHNELNKIFAVDKEVMETIGNLDDTSHSSPTGPAYANITEGIYFTSENGIAILLPVPIKESKFVTTLEAADFNYLFEIEDVWKNGSEKINTEG